MRGSFLSVGEEGQTPSRKRVAEGGQNPVASLGLKDTSQTCLNHSSSLGYCQDCGKRPTYLAQVSEGPDPKSGILFLVKTM